MIDILFFEKIDTISRIDSIICGIMGWLIIISIIINIFI